MKATATINENTLNTNIPAEMEKKIPCSLLIPENLLSSFENEISAFRSVNNFLLVLLENFGPPQEENDIPISLDARLTTRYQEKGQSLQRIDFRVESRVWQALKLIARSRGISMCYLFVILFIIFLNETDNLQLTQYTLNKFLSSYLFTENLNQNGNNLRKLTVLQVLSNIPPPVSSNEIL